MKKAKKVYIVWGNQDGNLGVFTNKKLAYEKCVEYMSYDKDTKLFTYSKFCKNLNRGYSSEIHNDNSNFVNASATMFWLNE
jgi:hypothetical protein